MAKTMDGKGRLAMIKAAAIKGDAINAERKRFSAAVVAKIEADDGLAAYLLRAIFEDGKAVCNVCDFDLTNIAHAVTTEQRARLADDECECEYPGFIIRREDGSIAVGKEVRTLAETLKANKADGNRD